MSSATCKGLILSVGMLVLAELGQLTFGQTPTGIISGMVKDQSGGVLANVRITITSKDTGLTRELLSRPDGSFGTPALPAGSYEVRCEAAGLRPLVQSAIVETG